MTVIGEREEVRGERLRKNVDYSGILELFVSLLGMFPLLLILVIVDPYIIKDIYAAFRESWEGVTE